MTFDDVLEQVIQLLQRQGRVSYRALKRRFALDDDYLEDLKEELIQAQRVATDEDGRILVWTGDARTTLSPVSPPQQTARQPDVQPDQSVQTASAPTQPRLPDAERRQLTVLFCDLVDSTRLARQLDPEEWWEVVRTYQHTCATVIQRFAGYIAQYLGDGLLVYFGYPQAHEDDAQRAVHTGLGILEAMATLNARLVPDKGFRLAVRVGIHTGLVVVGEIGGAGRQEQLALGDTPNVAARLQSLATPDTVAISDATWRLVQGYFACDDLGPQTFKGVETPVQVYRVLGISGAQSRLDVVSPRGLTPLVGREAEVTLLHERWAQARDGLGQVVLLSGEAGIGKSRLVQVLHEHVVAESHTHLQWHCSPYAQQSPLHPVIAHLHRLLRWRPDDAPAEKLGTLEETLAAYDLALPEMVPLFAALLSLPLSERYPPLTLTPQRQRQQTLDALLAWLLAEAARQPVLFVVEDLHWIDPSTLEFLTLFLDRGPTARILTLLTCRPEFRPPWGFRAHLTPLTLNRLPRPQVPQMIGRITSGKALPLEVVEQIVAKTDGVPLFVEELTKTVLESGLLREEEERCELTGPLLSLAIPTTLHDSLMARLDRLATVKDVAQLGATIGRTFAYELLQAVSPLDAATLQRGLRQLVEVELVYQRGVPPQATYTFKHALIQDVAYQSLLRSTRQQYHQRIAQVLATQFPETAETQPELLAHHLMEAGLHAPAVEAWRKAAQRSAARSAYVEAIAHATKGLEVLAGLPETAARTEQELALHLMLGTALQTTKGMAVPEVEQLYTRARELSQQVRESPQLVQALLGLRVFYQLRGDFHTARELGEQAVALASRVQAPGLLAYAHYSLGHTLFSLGAFATARAHFEHGVVSAVRQPQRAAPFVWVIHPEVSNRTILASALGYLGYVDQALIQAQQGCALAQELAHPPSLEVALSHTARVHLLRREAPLVHTHSAAALAIADEQGFAQRSGGNTVLRGWALSRQGQAEEGIAQIRQGIAAFRATSANAWCHYWLALLAEASAAAGQIAQGLTAVEEALTLVGQNGECFHEAELHRLHGELLLQQPSPAIPQVLTCFHYALEVARRQEAKLLELRALMSLARLWQQQGKRAEAHRLLAEIYGWFTEGFDTPDLQEAKALLEELA
jgi:class 3 adenylate cyclase/tetratricopeptide (TPR) repeat protein